MATHLRRLKITIRDTRGINPSWVERLYCFLTGMRWHWSVVQPQKLIPLADGHARTEEKARKRADRAALAHRAARPPEYTYMMED